MSRRLAKKTLNASLSFSKLLGLMTLLFVSACAHLEPGEKNIEETSALEMQDDKEAVLPQDMGLLTMKERDEKETLRNIEIENNDPVQSAQNEALKEENEVKEDVERKPAEQKAAPETITQAAVESSPIVEPYSEAEMTQLLFDAEKVIVKKGDTLINLAQSHTGESTQWKKIAALNPSVRNPNLIYPGQTLYLPKNPKNVAPVVAVAQTTPVENTPEVKNVEAPLVQRAIASSDNQSKTLKTSPKSSKNKDKTMERKPAQSVEEMRKDYEKNLQSKNISRIVTALGVLLFLAVFLSFFFSKPQKN